MRLILFHLCVPCSIYCAFLNIDVWLGSVIQACEYKFPFCCPTVKTVCFQLRDTMREDFLNPETKHLILHLIWKHSKNYQTDKGINPNIQWSQDFSKLSDALLWLQLKMTPYRCFHSNDNTVIECTSSVSPPGWVPVLLPGCSRVPG